MIRNPHAIRHGLHELIIELSNLGKALALWLGQRYFPVSSSSFASAAFSRRSALVRYRYTPNHRSIGGRAASILKVSIIVYFKF